MKSNNVVGHTLPAPVPRLRLPAATTLVAVSTACVALLATVSLSISPAGPGASLAIAPLGAAVGVLAVATSSAVAPAVAGRYTVAAVIVGRRLAGGPAGLSGGRPAVRLLLGLAGGPASAVAPTPAPLGLSPISVWGPLAIRSLPVQGRASAGRLPWGPSWLVATVAPCLPVGLSLGGPSALPALR